METVILLKPHPKHQDQLIAISPLSLWASWWSCRFADSREEVSPVSQIIRLHYTTSLLSSSQSLEIGSLKSLYSYFMPLVKTCWKSKRRLTQEPSCPLILLPASHIACWEGLYIGATPKSHSCFHAATRNITRCGTTPKTSTELASTLAPGIVYQLRVPRCHSELVILFVTLCTSPCIPKGRKRTSRVE